MADRLVVVPGSDGPIKGQLIDYKTVREEWNVYQLEDGTTIRVKLTVAQVIKGYDESTSETIYLPSREPLYHVRHEVRVIADVPDYLMQSDD